jgi:pimeloyl-ACP methyl ester carboxylesterase
MLPQLLSPTTRETQPELVTAVREMIGRASVAGVVAALHGMRDRADSRADLPRIAVPTLAICGADDTLTPPAGMRAMAAAIAAARYVEVPAAAHLTPLEQPLAVNRAVSEFLGALEKE